ncbi:hypothetical protein [Priestia koreensis]|uniref:hypothetical protein n=1 Tax=Priestia koreensis TaxID=284581 RepID=UPI001F570BB3|nr:hypothetical protein [Priestia koreensis]MCM3005709.1 hypothetical protein [Priestia koreensis]UNL87589.1 hypothetical protein IE339_24120 [Priestia koreensis]
MKAFFMTMIGFGVFYGIYYMITHFHTVLYWGLIGIGVIFGLSLLAKAIEGIQTWFMKTFRSEEYEKRMNDLMFPPNADKHIHLKDLQEIFDREVSEISFEEACDRIHKLPTQGDYTFVFAVNDQDELYAILPKPKRGVKDCPENKFYALPLKARYENESLTFDKIRIYSPLHKMPELFSQNQFSHFFDASSSRNLNSICAKLVENIYYLYYINNIQIPYFDKRRELMQELEEAITADDYRRVCMELEELKTPNADVVRMMLPTTSPSPKEILKSLGHDFDNDKNEEKSTITLHKEGDKNEWI